jgi:hypothetical protein
MIAALRTQLGTRHPSCPASSICESSTQSVLHEHDILSDQQRSPAAIRQRYDIDVAPIESCDFRFVGVHTMRYSVPWADQKVSRHDQFEENRKTMYTVRNDMRYLADEQPE